MPIRVLPPTIVNRIAAGEVIERPASAVKELVENAIDAGATRIEVGLRDGGRSLIAVVDDGSGMDASELELAVERHATSKLPGDDLTHIATLGFRGEALPSIGAVGRLVIASRKAGSDSGWLLAIEGGAKGALQPAALAAGTRVELRDLFYATPARLKFLKAPRTELDHVEDVINRLLGVTGAVAALPIWMAYMGNVLKGQREELPIAPEGVTAVAINPDTGLRDRNAPAPMIEYFYHENIPPEQDSPAGDDLGEGARPPEEVKDQLY